MAGACRTRSRVRGLETGFGVIEVWPGLSSVASALPRGSACLPWFAGMELSARVEQHRDASGVDDGFDDCRRPSSAQRQLVSQLG